MQPAFLFMVTGKQRDPLRVSSLAGELQVYELLT